MSNSKLFCTNCGAEITGNAFCGMCGEPAAAIASVEVASGVAANEVLQPESVEPQPPVPPITPPRPIKPPKPVKAPKPAGPPLGTVIAAKLRRMGESIKARYTSRPKLMWGLTALSLLALAYGVSEVVMFSTSSPTAVVAKYEVAIEENNFDALHDDTLFPGSATVEVPASVQAMRTSTTETVNSSITREFVTATVALNSTGDGETAAWVINVSAKPVWAGPFLVPNWTVDTPAPKLSVQIDKSLLNSQKARYNTVQGATTRLSNLATIENQTVLPGVYRVVLMPYGFIAHTSYSAISTTEQSKLGITLADAAIKSGYQDRANKSARKSVRWCALSKCRSLPRYTVNDFNLWSQYPRDTYTSSSFDWRYRYNSCSHERLVLSSPTRARMYSTCSVTAKGHLYVKYVYYSGYFSDYWYYWNFYDTRDYDASVASEFGIRPDGKGFKVIRNTVG